MLRKLFLIFSLSCLTLFAYNQTRNLEFYLNQGIQNSPLLNDYRNQIISTRADSLLVKAAQKPAVDAKSQLLYAPYYNNFGYDEVITDGGNYTAVAGVTQNILNKKELDNKYNAIEIQRRTVTNSSRITSTELNKIITDQYLISYSGYTDLLFNKDFLELLKKENVIVRQFVNNGIAKQTDYLALLVETQSQEILVSQIKNQYRKDLTILNQVCGLTDTAWYELAIPDITIKGTAEIKKSPVFIQYKIDSIRLENERAAIDIRYKPKVNWFADAGFLTSNPWNFYRHFGYSAGLSLSIPIYDGKQRGIEKQKIDLSQNSRQLYESTYHKHYFQQIQQLTNELKSINEVSARTEAQLATSEQLVKVLKEQLESGIILMTEYINAIKSYRTTGRNINLMKIQKLQVTNEMNFLLTQ